MSLVTGVGVDGQRFTRIGKEGSSVHTDNYELTQVPSVSLSHSSKD